MYLTLALLSCNLTRDRAVDLVCQPVLTCNGFQLEHTLDVLFHLIYIIRGVFIFANDSLILHNCLRRMTEHLCYVEVERFNTITLNEREVSVASGFTNNIHRCTLTLSNLLYVLEVLLINE